MTTRPVPAPGLRALLSGLVDYAGLFPPATLEMPAAVAGYRDYLASPDAWMLGRFVVPVARLAELAEASVARSHAAPWRLAALAGDDPPTDADRVAAFNAAHGERLVVDVVEGRASDPDAIARLAGAFAGAATVYVEVPHDADPRTLLTAVRRAGAHAKLRTGGVVAGAIPPVAQVARFIARCAELGLPFKATAGLHHPLRGEYRLTYAPGAPSATMFGFVNVFVAAALACAGVTEAELAPLLDERDVAAFRFDAGGLAWRDRRLSLDQLAAGRRFAVAFGSCSFREPVDDLRELDLL